MTAVKVNLPDFLNYWPWKRELNPYYEEAKRITNAWAHSFGFLDKKSQDAFDRCDFTKLAMITYPYMTPVQAVSACKLMALFYYYDEFSDVEGPEFAQQIADSVMNAIRFPEKPRPAGEFAIAELARQFWAEASKVASPMAQRHFIETFQQYVDAVTEQAVDRETDRIRSIDDFWAIRDHTGGCLPSFAFIELDLDFPEELYRSTKLERLREIANRSIAGCNDVYSYNIERARGHALHNIVTCAMYEKDMDVQEAARWFNDWHNDILHEFLRLREEVDIETRSVYGDDTAKQVRFYVDGLARWVRGSDDWHFEGERHFGKLGPEIQKTREVLMLPRVDLAVARKGVSAGEGGDDKIQKYLDVAAMQIDAAVPVQVGGSPTTAKASEARGWFLSIVGFFRRLLA